MILETVLQICKSGYHDTMGYHIIDKISWLGRWWSSIRGSRKFCQRGSNSANVFFFEGERIQVSLKAGQHRPVKRH